MFKKHRFEKVRKALEEIVGPENIFTDEAELLMYSYDAGMARAKPEAVLLFTATGQVAPAVKLLYAAGIPFLPRIAGTNLSGGTIPLKGGVILNLSLLDKIRQIDTVNRTALVEPGVVNLRLQTELDKFGFFYAPDPASQKVSTIGGNIGENAGGPQCLKYGVTSDNVLRLEVVTPEGEVKLWAYDDPGPDLMSLMIGSEGTLGVVTRAWLKILPKPKAVKTAVAAFASVENAIDAVARIIGRGIVPRALEAMDRMSLNAAAKTLKTDYPPGTEAILLLEIDGESGPAVSRELRAIEELCKACFSTYFRTAEDPAEREALWAARKGAYPAMARLAPNVLVEDGVVPRPRLPEALKETRDILSKYKLNAGLLFHAGDGNLHSNIVFDERDLQEVKRVKKAGYEILRSCIRLGGSISGEHGIGVEKRVAMNWMFDAPTLDFFGAIKAAFDPKDLVNPDKILPVAADRQARENSFQPGLFGEAANALITELQTRAAGGIKSLVRGTGTKLPKDPAGAGRQAARPLETSALDKVLDLDRGNFTVRAEAGIPVRDLRKWLKKAGFDIRLPDLDGSLGGAISAKSWPAMRDILLGMDVALADGSVLSLGGRTVKNVAGYDAMKIFCGSLGAYGAILTVTLRTALEAGPQEAPARAAAPFKPDEYHRRLKKAVDPGNLLNPWIYGE
ncbi:MAG: FAD-linked oxidase C-terminal domain-containing protein [Elusimicrobiales bacterium]|jgi:glycolate oxidase subunit GlcD